MYKLVVLFCAVAAVSAKPSVVAYSSVLPYNGVVPAVSSVSQYSSSVLHGSPYLAPSVYSSALVAPVGPAVLPAYAALAQPPHSPAVVLDPVNGVPLDTPAVVAARAAHYQAKALSGLHHLKKRSVVAPVSYSSVVSPLAYSSPVVSAYSAPLVSAYSSPLVSAYSSPLVSAYSSPLAYQGVGVVPRAYSVHPW